MKLSISANQIKDPTQNWRPKQTMDRGGHMKLVTPAIGTTRLPRRSRGRDFEKIDFCLHLEVERKLIWPARRCKIGPFTWRIEREKTKTKLIWFGHTNDLGSVWRQLQWAVAPYGMPSKEVEKSLQSVPPEWIELLEQLADLRVFLSWHSKKDKPLGQIEEIPEAEKRRRKKAVLKRAAIKRHVLTLDRSAHRQTSLSKVKT